MTTRNRGGARLAAAAIISLLIPAAALAAGGTPAKGPAALYRSAHVITSNVVSAARAVHGVTYGGVTSESYPLVLKTSKNGRKVVAVASQFFLPCASGMHLPYGEQLTSSGGFGDASGRIVSGSVSKTGRLRVSISGTVGDDSLSAAITETISGKLAQKRSSGSVHVHAPIVDRQSGRQVDVCDQTLSWRFGPQAQAYGGATSQHTPVVVELSKDRSKVKSFDLGWMATCSSGGMDFPGGSFPNFRLSKFGTFGDSFTDSSKSPDGSMSEEDAFKLVGKIGRSAGHGTFSYTEIDRDQSGVTTNTCGASLSWSVTG